MIYNTSKIEKWMYILLEYIGKDWSDFENFCVEFGQISIDEAEDISQFLKKLSESKINKEL